MSDDRSDPVDQIQIIITGPKRSGLSTELSSMAAGPRTSHHTGAGIAPRQGRAAAPRTLGQAVNFAA